MEGHKKTMIEYLEERGITRDNIDEHFFKDVVMDPELHPQWIEIYKKIWKLIPVEDCKRSVEEPDDDYARNLCYKIGSVDSDYFLVSESLDTRVYNRQDVVDSFIKRLGDQRRPCSFSFVLGRDIMTENGRNRLFEDFILPNIGGNVHLLFYTAKDFSEKPEFKAEILDNEDVTFSYPHYEFESTITRFHAKSPELASAIRDFYERKTFPMIDYEQIKALFSYKDGNDFGFMREIRELMGD
ncbi:hypothetical protein ACFL6I_21805 [candidate division KSB1 bacterium]